MITIAFVVRKDMKRRDGSYPVMLRVTNERKSAFIRSPYVLVKEQLTPKLGIKDSFILNKIQKDISTLYKIISEEYQDLYDKNVRYIAETLFKRCYKPERKKTISFPQFAETFIKEISERNKKSGQNYQAAVNRLCDFVGHDSFAFDDISPSLLREFDRWMVNAGIGPRGRRLYLIGINTIYKRAIEHYYDPKTRESTIPPTPFNHFTLPIQPKTEHRTLTVEQLRLIANIELKDPALALARDAFMLSFYTAGMNSVDMFNLKKISSGRITYYRSKTTGRRADRAEISIAVEPEAAEIINRYLGEKAALIYADRYNNAQTFNRQLNIYLKRIAELVGIEPFSFYYARHTGASILVNRCEKTEEDAAFYLGHASAHREASIYVEKDFSRIDRLNRMVIDYFKTT